MKHFLSFLMLAALLLTLPVSCCKKYDDFHDYSKRKVFIFYAAAYNNLSGYIREDLETMKQCLPDASQADKYKVLVISHTPQYSGDYYDATAPVIYDYYMDGDRAVRDTVYRFDTSCASTDPKTLSTALSFIKENYPAKEYGLCMSSHGSGWVPDDYYTFPTYDKTDEVIWLNKSSAASPGYVSDPILREYLSDNPGVKSACAQYRYGTDRYLSMNVPELVAAIPFKLEYLLFDMCMMGCVEIAYQLRDVVNYVAFSPMEIMSDGFQYKNILDHLFYSSTTDLVSVCRDTYEYYLTASSPYCTIALVDCTRLEPLAETCADLVSKYRAQLDSVDCSKVQRYFRSGRHFFYDLQDTFVKCGISAQDKDALSSVLSGCVVYKAATPNGIYYDFKITDFCGMSMCIPHICSDYIKNYYKVLDWNKATSLVE